MWLLQSINAVFLFRKSKYDAKKVLSQLPPLTPGCKASDDPAWTPGQWRAEQGYKDAMSDEKPVRETVLHVYNDAIKQISGMTDVKSIEPLTFRLKCEWDVATKNEQMICKEKVDEACQVVCKVITPNASEKLLHAYKQSAKPDCEIDALTTAYKNAPTKTLKTQILSIYALKYSCDELKRIHAPFENLSDRQIKKAKKHARIVGAGMAIEKTPFHRVRIDLAKLSHFLSFVDQPFFYQDVAYGTRHLKLESGKKLVMPNVVRTVGRSTMIELYFKQCREEEFSPLGRSTLYRILKVCEASQRKSLQGLDNIAAGGADGFDAKQKVVDILEESGANTKWCNNARKGLKSGKQYLKTEYQVHCRDAANPCPDHCRQHALSDQYAELQVNCDHEHSLVCESCEALKSVLSSFSTQAQSPEMSFYSEEQKDDILYDIRQATDMILQWKAHILRSENQDIAKTKLIKSLPSDTILILMDWAMKFTQLKYREKQSEWFGKRGMSWHVSCVISRSVTANCHQISSYVNLIDNCEQDWYAVCAILTNLLETIKGTQLHITKAYLRSDGAGCYHNNNLTAAVRNLGSQIGIQVIRSVKPIFVLCVT